MAEGEGALKVDSYECSVNRKEQLFPHHEIVSIDLHTTVMSCAAGVTFNSHEPSSAFWLTDSPNTCYVKQVNETEKHTTAAGFEARAEVDITRTKLTGGYWLDADVTAFSATGKAPQVLDKDHLPEEKGVLMENALCEKILPGKPSSPLKLYTTVKIKYVDPSMLYVKQVVETIGKVARVRQPLASLKVSSDSGIPAYSMRGTKSMSPLLRVCQVWLFLLVILLSPSHVFSSAEAKRESAEIGSCRCDLTSVATLSCVEPDGRWRPPSKSCCGALLYAIDHLPASNESGACCLCRYMSQRYPYFALAISYVLCKGKDRIIVAKWSPAAPSHMVCPRRNASSNGMDTQAAVSALGIGSEGFRTPWIAAIVLAAFCAILLACFCYRRSGESQPLNHQRRGSPSGGQGERKPSRRLSSAQRRMSSRGSPNG